MSMKSTAVHLYMVLVAAEVEGAVRLEDAGKVEHGEVIP